MLGTELTSHFSMVTMGDNKELATINENSNNMIFHNVTLHIGYSYSSVISDRLKTISPTWYIITMISRPPITMCNSRSEVRYMPRAWSEYIFSRIVLTHRSPKAFLRAWGAPSWSDPSHRFQWLEVEDALKLRRENDARREDDAFLFCQLRSLFFNCTIFERSSYFCQESINTLMCVPLNWDLGCIHRGNFR
jgi:hypothetical protein